MREILFRGKRVDNGEWEQGDLDRGLFANIDFISYFKNIGERVSYEIIPESIGQYTGVKDKNGKRIYEGDIVKVYGATGELKTHAGVVHWDDLFSGWKADDNVLYGSPICATYIIVGNIHDNPELLEGE